MCASWQLLTAGPPPAVLAVVSALDCVRLLKAIMHEDMRICETYAVEVYRISSESNQPAAIIYKANLRSAAGQDERPSFGWRALAACRAVCTLPPKGVYIDAVYSIIAGHTTQYRIYSIYNTRHGGRRHDTAPLIHHYICALNFNRYRSPRL